MGTGLTLSYLDYDGETGTCSIEGREITAVNFDAVQTEIGAIRNAINAVSRGTLRQEVRRLETTLYAPTLPANPESQREEKWTVLYSDTVNFKKFSFEIPCADLTLLDLVRRGYMNKSLAAFTTLKAALEAWMKSPYGNAITVNDLHFEGRDL